MLDKNPSIKCNVSSCKFNNKNKHYCKLETIKVGTHEKNPDSSRNVQIVGIILNLNNFILS